MTGARSHEKRIRDGIAGVRAVEIEPGRRVPNNWDDHMVESWAERKAKRQAAVEEKRP